MGYQALLFCPDEKTARTVTQVLSELEFTIEACIEPFAAVKKLMGQHFDAVVVDCDNEQNATLLFKSARNSTSNQASLAVAVVEGQAGVAKAFRIGANLVLTKPINIEQAKGTLRVARGLLRKADPAKPAAVSAAPPAKPAAAKPIPTAHPTTPAAVLAPAPAVVPIAKPAAKSAAAAKSIPAAQDDDLLEISSEAPVAAPPAPVPAFNQFGTPMQAAKSPVAAAPATTEAKSSFNAGLPATHGSGAASAPAPAREAHDSHVAEVSASSTPAAAEPLADTPAHADPLPASTHVGSEPSFTFGGANAPVESNAARKKILLGVAAAAIVIIGLYVAWAKFQGSTSQPAATPAPAAPAPVAVPRVAKPSGAQTAPVIPAPAPATSAPLSNSQPGSVTAKSQPADDSASEPDDASAPSSTKPSNSSPADKPAEAPLVVKGGKAPAIHSKTAVADAPAPSMIGIAAAGAGAPPPDLVNAHGSTPKPVLQALNVSQGVSQGLLIKKVQPAYPKNALLMRIEGAVELMATISKDGDIAHIKVLNGDPQLTRAAAEAVKQWKYKPYLLNGEPVEIQTQITINFKLPR